MSDDGSSDRTYEIMKEMASNYKGPHKIILNKNIPNLGRERIIINHCMIYRMVNIYL